MSVIRSECIARGIDGPRYIGVVDLTLSLNDLDAEKAGERLAAI